MAGPAYRIETERLIVRCWEPHDAPLLQSAVEVSLEHLRPWMPWARGEPKSLDERVDLLRTFRARFDLDQEFVYGIFDRKEARVLGGAGLHKRAGDDSLEIGYWVHVDHTGQGLATEASAALTKVAFDVHGVDRVEIHCEPANDRSAAVPARLGFVCEATLRRRLVAADGTLADRMIWTLLREELSSSPAASARVAAFDVIGRRVL